MRTHCQPLFKNVVALSGAAHEADGDPPAVILHYVEGPEVTPLAPFQLNPGTLRTATGVRPSRSIAFRSFDNIKS